MPDMLVKIKPLNVVPECARNKHCSVLLHVIITVYIIVVITIIIIMKITTTTSPNSLNCDHHPHKSIIRLYIFYATNKTIYTNAQLDTYIKRTPNVFACLNK